MRISHTDMVALLIVLAGTVASLVVWDYGRVDLGMEIEADASGMTDPPGVIVRDITHDGNAARSGFQPLSQVIDLTTLDGSDVKRGEPIGQVVYGDRRGGRQP